MRLWINEILKTIKKHKLPNSLDILQTNRLAQKTCSVLASPEFLKIPTAQKLALAMSAHFALFIWLGNLQKYESFGQLRNGPRQ